MTEQIWARKCIVKDCENIALFYSSFCAIHKKLKEQGDKETSDKSAKGRRRKNDILFSK